LRIVRPIPFLISIEQRLSELS
jgi:hypothetical protein